MGNDLDLKIRISAELKGIREALNGLGAQIEQLGKRSDEANRRQENGANRLGDSLSSAKKQLVALVAGYASIATVKGLIRLADEAKLLDARLKLATRSQEELKVAQQATYEIAQRTRTPLKETTELYAKIANATKDQAYSQQTILNITETINKAVQISGADQAAASAAIMQLGQGLASGTLRGEELNSVLEQTPRLADAIAKGMGITRGELRAYGAEGKITAEAVIEALEKQKAAIDSEFAQLPETVGGSITKLENNFMRLVATLDANSGATATIAEAIGLLAEHLEEIVKITGILGTVIVATYLTKAIPAITAYIAQTYLAIKANKEFGSSMTKSQKTFSVFAAAVVGWEIGSYLESEFTIVRQAGIALMSGLQTTWAKLVGFFREAGATLEFMWTAPFDAIRESIAQLFEQLAAIAKEIPGIGEEIARAAQAAANMARSKSDTAQKYRETVARINAETAAEVRQIDEIYSEMFANADKERNGASGPTASSTAPAGAAKKTPGGAVDPLALMKDQVARELAELERAYAAAEVSHAAYFERRKELAIKAVDLEITEHQRALAAITGTDADATEKRSKELTEIAILERKKNDIRIDAARGLAQAEKETQQQLNEVRQASMEAEGRTLEVRNEQIIAKYRDLLKRLTAEGNTAGVELVNKLINVEQAQARLDDIDRRVKAALDKLHAAEQSAESRVVSGDTSPARGEEEQRRAREETLAKLIEERKGYELLAVQGYQPAKEKLAELDRQISEVSLQNATNLERGIHDLRAEYAKMSKDFAGDSMKAARDSLSTFFYDLAMGTKSGKEALMDFVRSFASSMAQIASKALATYVVLQTLDAIYPGLGKATAGMMGADVKHTGGIAGGGGVRRNVPAFMFAGAPRYHSGGEVLAPGEVPAILQAGEEVLTRDDPRHVANGGGQTNGGVRILNVVDPSLVSDYMSSSQGEQVIVNAIQRNAGAVKQLLA
jgi:tape measure domain-containing protein